MLSKEFVSELESIGEIDDLKLVEFLNEVLKSDNINFQNNNRETALLWASYFGEEKVVELLLKYGADVNIQNNNGTTPLMCASWFEYANIVELLLENGADVNIQNSSGKSVLDFVVKYKYKNIENMLRNASQIRDEVVLKQEDESKNILEEHKKVIKRVFR